MKRTNALAAIGGSEGVGTPATRAKKDREWVFRIYLHKDVWWIDLRKLSLGRVMMRDPGDSAWPAVGRTTTSQSEAQRWAGIYADRVPVLVKAQARRADRKVLRDEFELFLAEKGQHEELTDSTIATYHTIRDYLYGFCGGSGIDPRAITAADVKRIDSDWVARGLAATSRRKYRNALRVFFRWCGFDDNPKSENANPSQAIKLPKGNRSRHKVKWWTQEEMASILAAAAALDEAGHPFPSFTLAVTLAHASGARENELFALRHELLDWGSGCIGIHGQLDRKTGRVRHTKGVEPRWAVMFPEAWELLQEHGRGFILCDPATGQTMRPWRQRNMIDNLRAKVLELNPTFVWPTGIGWHSFRHTYSTRVLDAGCPMEDLQQFLGHKTLQITQQHYYHHAPTRAVRRGAALVHGGKTVRSGRRLRAVS
jgi:integrase